MYIQSITKIFSIHSLYVFNIMLKCIFNSMLKCIFNSMLNSFIYIAYLCSDILTGRLVGGGGKLLKVTHEAINVWIRQDAK